MASKHFISSMNGSNSRTPERRPSLLGIWPILLESQEPKMPVLTSRDVAYLPTNETPSDAIGRASTPGGSTHPESACAVAGISAVNWIGTRVPESGAADANTFHRSIGIGFPEPPQSAEGHATG